MLGHSTCIITLLVWWNCFMPLQQYTLFTVWLAEYEDLHFCRATLIPVDMLWHITIACSMLETMTQQHGYTHSWRVVGMTPTGARYNDEVLSITWHVKVSNSLLIRCVLRWTFSQCDSLPHSAIRQFIYPSWFITFCSLQLYHLTLTCQVPIGWAIDPELSLRFPVIFPYLYSTRTASDFFIAGDSGAGYLNPTQLIPPRQVS